MEILLSLAYGPETQEVEKRRKGSMTAASIPKFNELMLVTVLSCETECLSERKIKTWRKGN